MTTPFNLGDLHDRTRDPTKIAYHDLRAPDAIRDYSHGEVDELTRGVARHLVRLGLPKGTRIGILAWNRAEYAFAYFGITRAGYVAVPINTKVPDETVHYVVADADVKLVFVDRDHAGQVPNGVPVIDFDDDGVNGFWSVLDRGAFETYRPAHVDEIGEILYTSGSTGKPKGVPLSHAGQIWMMLLQNRGSDEGSGRFLVAQPLFHMAGLFAPKRALLYHSELAILPGFEPRRYIETAARYGVTTIGGVPTLLARVIKETDLLASLDLTSIRSIVLGSAPLTQALFDKIQAAFPLAKINHGYGSTEAGGGVFDSPKDGRAVPPLSVGVLHDDIEVRLVDGVSAAEGVMQVRSPAVFRGYLNLPDLTARVVNDGWYTTGDIMRRDRDGFYYFVGRADDMFVCGGENIYPGEVEKLIEQHSAVHQASVVPLPDEERSQIPVAFIVRKPGHELNFNEVKTYALANGPTYQYPRRVAFLPELPLGKTNKIDRNALKDQARVLEARGGWAR